ncbi:hypothetical protein FQR65_LT19000 [Abscondita terminalis]|nr:hypothetical protein FQR65_LT19000 [Abscondita terminalis]
MNQWIGYSSDGIIYENDKPVALLEIKCPFLGKSKSIGEVIQDLPYIEFKKSNGECSVALVSSVWLTPRKKEVFWPPYKQAAQFERVLKNHTNSDDSWKLYAISRCFFVCDEYEKARKKIKQAEVTSDICTDLEDEAQGKRKRSCPRRLSYGTSSDDEGDSVTVFSRPPAYVPAAKETDFVVPKRRSNLNLEASGSSTPIIHRSEDRLPFRSNTDASVTNIIDIVSDESASTNTVFQKKIFTVLFQIKEQNAKIIVQNDKIINLLNKNNPIANATGCKPADLPVQLPLSNVESVDILEQYLSNKENLSALSSYLSTLGGRDATTKINKVLRILMDDSIASLYSYYGKRQAKKPFCELSLKTAIVDCIKANTANTSEKDIEDAIKIWLKHAPQRQNATINSKRKRID